MTRIKTNKTIAIFDYISKKIPDLYPETTAKILYCLDKKAITERNIPVTHANFIVKENTLSFLEYEKLLSTYFKKQKTGYKGNIKDFLSENEETFLEETLKEYGDFQVNLKDGLITFKDFLSDLNLTEKEFYNRYEDHLDNDFYKEETTE